MENTIIISLRALSFYIAFTIIIEIPNYIYTLYLFNASAGLLMWGIGAVLISIIYHIVFAWIIWLLAPYLSKMINRKYNADINFSINATLLLGLAIVGTKYVFEKLLFLIKYVWGAISLLRNSVNEGVIMKGEPALAKLLISPFTITSLVSIIIIGVFFINYSTLEKVIIAHIK